MGILSRNQKIGFAVGSIISIANFIVLFLWIGGVIQLVRPVQCSANLCPNSLDPSIIAGFTIVIIFGIVLAMISRRDLAKENSVATVQERKIK